MITVAAIYLAHELSKGLKPSEETKMSLIRLEKKKTLLIVKKIKSIKIKILIESIENRDGANTPIKIISLLNASPFSKTYSDN